MERRLSARPMRPFHPFYMDEHGTMANTRVRGMCMAHWARRRFFVRSSYGCAFVRLCVDLLPGGCGSGLLLSYRFDGSCSRVRQTAHRMRLAAPCHPTLWPYIHSMWRLETPSVPPPPLPLFSCPCLGETGELVQTMCAFQASLSHIYSTSILHQFHITSTPPTFMCSGWICPVLSTVVSAFRSAIAGTPRRQTRWCSS